MALSTTGIAHQIASSIYTYKHKELGTINDCKVAINLLIRKFDEPLEKEGKKHFFRSKKLAEDEKGKREHIVPVNVIMNHLLENEKSLFPDEFAEYIEFYLTDVLREMALITKEENSILSKNGFNEEMPIEYFDPSHKLFRDVWARYICADIYKNLVHA